MSQPIRRATHEVHARLATQFGELPFTSGMAADAGVSRQQLRSAYALGHVTRLRKGIYAVSRARDEGDSALGRARAALLALNGVNAAVAGVVASQLHGLPFVEPPSLAAREHKVEVMVAAPFTPRCGYRSVDSVVRRVDNLPPDIQFIEDIPVTSLLHTAIDVARMGRRTSGRPRAQALLIPEALVPLDAATYSLGARTQSEAADMVKAMRSRFRHCPGIRSVDQILDLLDPLAETALESWSRGYMAVYGVPRPLTQQTIVGADGVPYRVDFCWPEHRIIGEADGLGKYGDTPEEFRKAKEKELTRQRALEAAGWTVVRWTWDELARDPQAVMRRILQALFPSS